MITKLEASILWGNGFKLKDKEGAEYKCVGFDDEDGEDLLVRDESNKKWNVSLDIIGTQFFIICHPLSMLTQSIQHEGKEIVPIVELAKIAFPNEAFSFEQGLEIVSCMDFDFGYRNGQFLASGYAFKSVNVPSQPALFAYMDSLHIDFRNWQERGLTTPKDK